jgi:uncharacterized DUF497 family protein
MRFEWDEAKRALNLREHGFDFADAHKVFSGLTATYEDDRFRYDEQRFVTLGLLNDVAVSIVHTEQDDIIRVISFRQATQHETDFLFQNIAAELPQGTTKAPKKRGKAHGGTPGAGRRSRRTRHRKKGPKAGPS